MEGSGRDPVGAFRSIAGPDEPDFVVLAFREDRGACRCGTSRPGRCQSFGPRGTPGPRRRVPASPFRARGPRCRRRPRRRARRPGRRQRRRRLRRAPAAVVRGDAIRRPSSSSEPEPEPPRHRGRQPGLGAPVTQAERSGRSRARASCRLAAAKEARPRTTSNSRGGARTRSARPPRECRGRTGRAGYGCVLQPRRLRSST